VEVWIPDRTRPEHRALLPPDALVHHFTTEGQLAERLGRGDFLVAGFDVDRLADVISRLDGLRVIQTLSAGVDHYVERIPAGVTLCDASGVHDVPVSEWVVMAILASIRNLSPHLEAQRSARWPAKPGPEGDDLEGATVLILGYGSIGRSVEARLAPFGVRFLRVALHARDGVSAVSQLPALLPQADIVVVLLPLTDATRGFVDTDFIARMRPGALLVNAARGPIVDTGSLTAGVQGGRIRAALDVTDPEPLTPGHPLWSAPGVLITPHIGGWVRKRLDRSWRLVADQVARFARGEPLRNIVVDGY
jgi:phosphoglycerate dehydrogenase-like enzyme